MDFSKLSKGDRIPSHLVEEMTKTSRNSRDYPLEILKLCKAIEKVFDELGTPVTTCSEKDDILILTDEQASKYNANQFELGRRKMSNSNRRMANVDASDFSLEERMKHNELLVKQSRVLEAITKAKRVVTV